MFIHERILLRAGFLKIANWQIRNGALIIDGIIPNKRAVYAITLTDHVQYIGSTDVGLKKRIYGYLNPGRSQSTNIKINKLIVDHLLKKQKLSLLAAFPPNTTWNGLPIDGVMGLESGLIKKLNPPWNIKGKPRDL
ncbi:MAG: hypothetical protein ACRBBJ_01055 [Rhodomicrobiaceae bacterium]